MGFAMRMFHMGLDISVEGEMTTPPVGKGDLLNAAGYAKDDKTARARLEKYDGIYWKSSRRHTRIFYQLL